MCRARWHTKCRIVLSINGITVVTILCRWISIPYKLYKLFFSCYRFFADQRGRFEFKYISHQHYDLYQHTFAFIHIPITCCMIFGSCWCLWTHDWFGCNSIESDLFWCQMVIGYECFFWFWIWALSIHENKILFSHYTLCYLNFFLSKI